MTATTTATPTSAPSTAQLGRADHSRFPPIEQFHTIDGLLRNHAAEHDQKPLICYPVHTASDFEEYTAAEIDRCVDITAQYYIQHGLPLAVSRLHRWHLGSREINDSTRRTHHWKKVPWSPFSPAPALK